ncbi:MAG: acyl CoA:acetate/3-ketoacid CoA transferase [Dehalobacterium sp.]
MSKVRKPEELVSLIADGATVAVSGMGLAGWNEEMAAAVEKHFLETGHPKDITLFQACALGDWTPKRGPTHFGHEGLTKRWIGAHIGSNPNMIKLVEENKVEAFNLPQGVLVQLWREIAAKRPGVITKVGLKTYVDPRLEGGKLNDLTRSKEDIVKVIEFEGEEYLFYKSFPIDVALIRGTVADENGNLTMDKEGQLNGAIHLAQAAKNSGGIVIAQAEYVAQANTLHPKDVRVPGILVDYVVVATSHENQWQTEGQYYNPAFAGNIKVPLGEVTPLPLNERKIIARRAAMELENNVIVNLGVGMPTDVANVAAEENASDLMVLTTEAGGIGGVPASLPDFGHSFNAEALIEMPTQFDYYDGGGLDIAFLGLAQTDRAGNVNVTQFGPKIAGCGGFVNVTQSSKKVVFTGSFTAGGLKVRGEDGKLIIDQEGRHKKFLEHVEHISFSGRYAFETKQPVIYVTERAVFTIEEGEMTMIEIAPGIDIEKDILPYMGFKPRVSPNLKTMPSEIFQPVWGGLRSYIESKK